MRSVAAAALLFASSSGSLACTLLMSPEYHTATGKKKTMPVAVTIQSTSLSAWIDGCDAGFIVIQLMGQPISKLKRQGFYVRPVSGVHTADAFPKVPLAAQASGKNVTLSWAWDSIIPDNDGHVRWQFEVIPVSSSGVLGTPVAACASTDKSCPVVDAP